MLDRAFTVWRNENLETRNALAQGALR